MKEHPSEKRMTTGKLTELALLTAAALILYVVELQIPNPIPIPGAKLGLANIVTVYAVYRYRPGEVLMVVLVRIFLGSLFGGSMMTFLYSLAGSLLCLLGMLLLRHMVSGRAIWLASVLGAVLHNTGQLQRLTKLDKFVFNSDLQFFLLLSPGYFLRQIGLF